MCRCDLIVKRFDLARFGVLGPAILSHVTNAHCNQVNNTPFRVGLGSFRCNDVCLGSSRVPAYRPASVCVWLVSVCLVGYSFAFCCSGASPAPLPLATAARFGSDHSLVSAALRALVLGTLPKLDAALSLLSQKQTVALESLHSGDLCTCNSS